VDKQWHELSPDEKLRIRQARWLSGEGTKFVSLKAKRLFQERETRITSTIQLKIPDRVPIWLQDLSFFPAKYTGATFQNLMYDSRALVSAFKKTLLDFEPDMFFRPPLPTTGEVLDILDCRQLKWPGNAFAPDRPFQYVEGEYMKADEYDEFINDPTDFIIRKYLPRFLGVLKPMEKLPSFKGFLSGYMGLPKGVAFAGKDMVSAFKSFYRAAVKMQKHDSLVQSFIAGMKNLGYPPAFGGSVVAPFDIISDTLRGMHGVMIDMYRRPDKLQVAIEKITPFLVESVIDGANNTGNPRAMITMHRGSDCFMSKKQWDTFYWPGYKKILVALLNEGITPVLFLEGNVTSRLEYFADLPRGRVLALLDSTDMFKAKEILGNKVCISGMMPVSLLQMGTPDEVKAYAKKLIDVCGKDGGFIMGPRSVMDEANPALVKVWFDYTKEYGVYK
jgi:hypothetical protein